MFYLPQSAFAGRATRQISQTLLTINLHIKTILLLFLFILLNHSAYHSTGLLTTGLIKRRGLIIYQSHIKTDFSTPCTTENLLQVSKNNQHSYVLIRVGGWGAALVNYLQGVECLILQIGVFSGASQRYSLKSSSLQPTVKHGGGRVMMWVPCRTSASHGC